MRIVSFLPTGTEMLYALGLGRSLVGRSQHCLYPPQVKSKPVAVSSRVKKIAPQDSLAIHKAVLKLRKQNTHQFEINLPLLKRLKPDLVITQNLCSVCAASHDEVAEALQHLSPKPKVITLRSQKLSEVIGEIERLGAATGRKAAAARLAGNLRRRLEVVRKRVSKLPRPRVWCCEWLEPLMAAGHWVPEQVEWAGGTDALGIAGKNSRWLKWEEVRAADPEVILTMPCSYTIRQTLQEKHRLTGRPGWKNLSAVKNGRVFAVAGEFFHHAGPRLINGVELLAQVLHSRELSHRLRTCRKISG
ncbi:MAG: cobalamin-binding protein [Candidatus Omnitrophota bacterium]|nr:cobalamin-binding protein [Candidatus Omnitrophota bacterium]